MKLNKVHYSFAFLFAVYLLCLFLFPLEAFWFGVAIGTSIAITNILIYYGF